MKKSMKFLPLIAALLMSSTILGQKAEMNMDVHPIIEQMTKKYELDEAQVTELTKVYDRSSRDSAQIDEIIKQSNIKQQETAKTATPAEKDRMRSEIEGLNKRRQIIEQSREEAVKAILTDEQRKMYEADMKEKLKYTKGASIDKEEKKMKKEKSTQDMRTK
jgi:Spy/CpxP family protein refolding chaperone